MSVVAAKQMKLKTITLAGRLVKYAIRESGLATECRIRIGPAGVQVITPIDTATNRARRFLRDNATWVLGQIDRVSCLPTVRANKNDQFQLRGKPVCISVDKSSKRRGSNLIECTGSGLRVQVGNRSTPPARTVENWLRRQARGDVELAIAKYVPKVRRSPNKLYIMGQRTKWGNCSARGNLSFNWRLVMAPPFVLDYLVAHELSHLVIPSHTQEFWLVVRGICPRFFIARKWLKDHGHELIAWQARRALR